MSPAFFGCLGSPNRLMDMKVIADIGVRHLHDTVYEPGTHIDLVFNSSTSTTPLLLTTMNTLSFVFRGKYMISRALDDKDKTMDQGEESGSQRNSI